MSCCGTVPEAEADAGGCLFDILWVMVLAVFTRSAIRQLPMLPYLGSLFL